MKSIPKLSSKERLALRHLGRIDDSCTRRFAPPDELARAMRLEPTNIWECEKEVLLLLLPLVRKGYIEGSKDPSTLVGDALMPEEEGYPNFQHYYRITEEGTAAFIRQSKFILVHTIRHTDLSISARKGTD